MVFYRAFLHTLFDGIFSQGGFTMGFDKVFFRVFFGRFSGWGCHWRKAITHIFTRFTKVIRRFYDGFTMVLLSFTNILMFV